MCRAFSARTATSHASPVCLDSAPARRRRRAVTLLLATAPIASALPEAPRADILHLKDGRRIEAGSCRLAGEEWKCRRAGGEVGFLAAQVARVEAAPMPPSPVRLAGEDTRAPATTKITVDLSSRAAGSPVGASPLASPGQDPAANEISLREALALAPADPDRHVRLAALLIATDRHDEADPLLREALALRPDDAGALEWVGESAFQRGRIPDAIAAWERALSIQPGLALHERLVRARRLLSAEEGFRQSDGLHFALKYDGGEASAVLAEEILRHLDDEWSRLAGVLAHYPDGIFQVVLYSTRAFRDATLSPDAVSGLFDGQIRIPIRGLDRLTPPARRVLTHELSHAFLASASRGNAPRWLQEGFAQIQEGLSALAVRRELQDGWRTGGGIAWAREFSYPVALSQVEYLVDTWSGAHLNEIARRLGRGEPIDAAMNGSLGLDTEAFLSSWGEWLTR